MHRAALNGLKMVGNKLSAKEEVAYRNKGTHKPRSLHRHSTPRHRSGSRRSRTPSPGRHKSPKYRGTRRSSPQIRRTITKTTKRRWEHHASPIGFAPRQYPKVSNYLMINKNTMDPRSHSHGSRIICKQ
jgi:hypothetical protein